MNKMNWIARFLVLLYAFVLSNILNHHHHPLILHLTILFKVVKLKNSSLFRIPQSHMISLFRSTTQQLHCIAALLSFLAALMKPVQSTAAAWKEARMHKIRKSWDLFYLSREGWNVWLRWNQDGLVVLIATERTWTSIRRNIRDGAHCQVFEIPNVYDCKDFQDTHLMNNLSSDFKVQVSNPTCLASHPCMSFPHQVIDGDPSDMDTRISNKVDAEGVLDAFVEDISVHRHSLWAIICFSEPKTRSFLQDAAYVSGKVAPPMELCRIALARWATICSDMAQLAALILLAANSGLLPEDLNDLAIRLEILSSQQSEEVTERMARTRVPMRLPEKWEAWYQFMSRSRVKPDVETREVAPAPAPPAPPAPPGPPAPETEKSKEPKKKTQSSLRRRVNHLVHAMKVSALG